MRVKGIPNRVSKTAKDNIIAVFTRLGSTHAMAEWARENKTEFYRLYARLIPTQIQGSLEVTHKVETGDSASLSQRLIARPNTSEHTVQ